MKLLSIPFLTALGLLSSCATESHRRASESAAAEKEVAQETRRVCALPSAERDAELERIDKEFGIAVHCGRDQPASIPIQQRPR